MQRRSDSREFTRQPRAHQLLQNALHHGIGQRQAARLIGELAG